ncbi:unnamed protein product [Didymodactylos carnosus]|uniref:Uncharacterized protein n=1 Tax=Didymodactylos carnosus TaxID=1234261 RepID=A0A8S2V986_9BILA|nr:unnamed protein product [Didymodactylos carnosus]CAF4381164.1 unnamed protein product [Didymodactylos carnosus]
MDSYAVLSALSDGGFGFQRTFHFKDHSVEFVILDLEKTKRLNMNEYIDIPFVFHLEFPCSVIEFEIIRKLNDNLPCENNETAEDLAYKQLRKNSFYKQYLDTLIMNDEHLFQLYYHDQLLLFLNEHKIQLSVDFVFQLLSSKNLMKKPIDRIICI